MNNRPTSFKTIRSWDGSQNRAFEELCYQLRDPTPDGWTLWKPGNPDGGFEWYIRNEVTGEEHGWQAKYAFTVKDLLPLMKETVESVVKRRPSCTRLTFCIPVDLPDSHKPPERISALQKYRNATESWAKTIQGADKIEFVLWSEGALFERLNRPENDGTAWFFWDEELFGPEWLRGRLQAASDAAADRYQPKLNVELPIAAALEGLGHSELFLKRYRERRGAMIKAAKKVDFGAAAGLGVAKEAADLGLVLRDAEMSIPRDGVTAARFDRTRIDEYIAGLLPAIVAAEPDENGDAASEARKDFSRGLSTLYVRAADLQEFLDGPAARSAESGQLLMTGEAGQGKTHLFCDAVVRSLSEGRPSVVVLGGRFRGGHVFQDLASALTLGDVGAAKLLRAMRAAGEACGKPFVLLIDALNDTHDPQRWEHDLPALLAEAKQHAPWVHVGVSVRSAYLDVIASEPLDKMTRADHPGLAGRETDAIERYFGAAGLDLPRTPMLLPEFSNPLFLKLYCDGASEPGATSATDGHAHISDVFERYLAAKNRTISQRLDLRRTADTVGRAVRALAARIPVDRPEVLRESEAEELIDSFAPNRTGWPNTLYGALLSEGILTHDLAYLGDDDDERPVQVTEITFQRFSDYLSAESLVADYKSAEDLAGALSADGELRATFAGARAGVVRALSVLVPERLGVELLDLPSDELTAAQVRRREEALLKSIVARRDDAVSARTVELFSDIAFGSRAHYNEALRTLLTVAPRRGHQLNAEFLHGYLFRQSMAERDASWGKASYYWFDEQEPLDRLIRWLQRGPSSDFPDADLELGLVPVVWALTSPNRYLRDYVTKVLAGCLSSRLPVLVNLIERFRSVNDPYVLQRLGVAAHGAVIQGGTHNPTTALSVARLLTAIIIDPDTTPNVVLRDAARGCMEWSHRAGLIDAEEYAGACPPYASDPPSEPRSLEELEATYGRNEDDPGYAAILFSIFHMGDFGRYVIGSKLRNFSGYRFSETVAPAGYEDDVDRSTLAEILGEEPDPEPREPMRRRKLDPRRDYPTGAGQRWVFERVVQLGWTPERFDEFDRSVGSRGRDSHKAERFGKKYQWIALHELIARVADNFQMRPEMDGSVPVFQGPFEFFGRDIDPTLPPARRHLDSDGVESVAPTFASDPSPAWWEPQGPVYSPDGPPVEAGWAESADGIPPMQPALFSTDPDGVEWITLHGLFRWTEPEVEDQDRYDVQRRDLWAYLFSWLVKPTDVARATKYLKTRSFMGRWMPEGRDIADAAYLGEIPLSASAQKHPLEWEPVENHEDGDTAPDIEVYPAWEGYHWEGHILDCSIEDSVFSRMPSELLFKAGELRWLPGTRSWTDGDSRVVAQHRETADDHAVLLVRSDWLDETLEKLDLCLIVGFFGEKQLISEGYSPRFVGGWTIHNAFAVLKAGRWKIHPQRTEIAYSAG